MSGTSDNNARALERRVRALSRMFFLSISIVSVFVILDRITPRPPEAEEKIIAEELPEFENGIHLETGLIESEHIDLVIANCTGCHSANMITQNRATRNGWKDMIAWMQATQNLWDLGENESLILDYLAANYAPIKRGRRAPLTNIEWYELED